MTMSVRLLIFFFLIQTFSAIFFFINQIPQTAQLALSIFSMPLLTVPLVAQYMTKAGYKWTEIFTHIDKNGALRVLFAAALTTLVFTASIKVIVFSLPEHLAAKFTEHFLRPSTSALLNSFNDLAKKGLIGSAFAGALMLMLTATEELVFRGFIFTRLSKQKGVLLATLVSAALFGLIHLQPYRILIQSIGGILFAYAFIRTKTLITPILAHWLFNCSFLFFGTPLSLWLFR